MPTERWNIVECDPVTGQVSNIHFTHARALTVGQVVQFLREGTGFNPEAMAKYAIGDADSLRRFTSAERWMEDHAAEHVVAAWSAGAPAAQKARQDKLREWWPDLGLALDNLVANHAEA